MNVSFPVNEMIKVFQVLGPVIPSRSTRPILTHVLINVDKRMRVMATDLEIAIEHYVEGVDGQDKGQLVIPANRLSAICHEFQNKSITMETQDRSLSLRCETSQYKLPMERSEDFPEISFKAKKIGAIPLDLFKQMIKKTIFATATERSRFAINGVHITCQQGILKITATDGRRLAHATTKVPGGLSDFTAIIPPRALSLLMKADVADTSVNVEMDENQVVFHLKDMSIMARLITGRFPDYESVIPKSNKNTLKIGKGDFEGLIRKAALVTSEESKSVKLSLSQGKISASAKTQVHGESMVSMDTDYKGQSLDIRFNPSYLIDGLKACDGKDVVFTMKDSNSAASLSEDGKDGYCYVVTPINIVS
ncbi:MAG: DNA polymerase III subunit beta [Planctomycetota bacterium]